MKTFEFSNLVIDKVLLELEGAKKYIKIAVFQMHLNKIYNLIERKLKEGVKVDIITLPYDSINESVRKEVVARLESIQKVGAKLHFCKWNVGNPERTTTAIGKWYSFHGKFIVTEKSAICLSANFTDTNELDACLILSDEQLIIDNFNKKFEDLLKLFVIINDEYDGNIRSKIIDTAIPGIEKVFELPSIIETKTHFNNWITDYPSLLCPDEIEIKEGLYIVPFDIKGRKIYEKIINEAHKYVYISAESFTDIEFGLFLRKIKAKKSIQIKLLTGFTSMDFTDRIQKMYREILAEEIEFYTIEDDLHGKILITDKHLLVGSINLNKMNLGFNRTLKYWRGNTETFFVTQNNILIKEAKIKFENQLNNSIEMALKLSQKIQKEVSESLNKLFEIRASKEVKELFSRFIYLKEIEVKKDATKLVRITKKLMDNYDIKIANTEIFFMAIILFYLQDRKHTISEIDEKLIKMEFKPETNKLLQKLVESCFIEKEKGFYKINLESLFKKE